MCLSLKRSIFVPNSVLSFDVFPLPACRAPSSPTDELALIQEPYRHGLIKNVKTLLQKDP